MTLFYGLEQDWPTLGPRRPLSAVMRRRIMFLRCFFKYRAKFAILFIYMRPLENFESSMRPVGQFGLARPALEYTEKLVSDHPKNCFQKVYVFPPHVFLNIKF